MPRTTESALTSAAAKRASSPLTRCDINDGKSAPSSRAPCVVVHEDGASAALAYVDPVQFAQIGARLL